MCGGKCCNLIIFRLIKRYVTLPEAVNYKKDYFVSNYNNQLTKTENIPELMLKLLQKLLDCLLYAWVIYLFLVLWNLFRKELVHNTIHKK